MCGKVTAMKRIFGKTFGLLLALMLTAAGLAHAAPRLVATIVPGNLPRYEEANHAFEEILRAGGFSADKLEIFTQTPNFDEMSLRNSARRAVAAGAELIVTYGALATQAAIDEAGKTPVLFADVYAPDELGFVQSMQAPGVNRSGASCQVPFSPLLNKIQEMRPGARVAVLFNPQEPDSEIQLKGLKAEAESFSLKLFPARLADTADKTVSALVGKADFLLLTHATAIEAKLDSILLAATDHNLPVVACSPTAAGKGALLTYAVRAGEQGKLAAVHALQTLAGQKLFLLPVRKPVAVPLILDLQVAGRLGMSIDDKLTTHIDRVLK